MTKDMAREQDVFPQWSLSACCRTSSSDPPYDLGRRGCLRNGDLSDLAGLVTIEYSKDAIEPPEEFEVLRDVLSGDSRLTFLRLKR
jgi:hypothetical protein